MTKGQLVEMLLKTAQEYAADAVADLKRNEHMHKFRGTPDNQLVDAVIVGLVNRFAGQRCGMDLALYTQDLHYETFRTQELKSAQ